MVKPLQVTAPTQEEITTVNTDLHVLFTHSLVTEAQISRTMTKLTKSAQLQNLAGEMLPIRYGTL